MSGAVTIECDRKGCSSKLTFRGALAATAATLAEAAGWRIATNADRPKLDLCPSCKDAP